MKKRYHLMIWPALMVILLDQASKLAIIHGLQIHESITVIAGFFNLVHARNRGMAFGIMNRPDINFGFYILLCASITAIVLLLIWFFRLKHDNTWITVGLSLILGGAAGNLIDRLRFREVIDFLDFYLGSYHWPAFNVADSAITAGTFIVAISLLFQPRSHVS